MVKVKNLINLWLPVFAWMGVLFWLSSISNLRAVENSFWDEIVRSGAHFIFYAIGYLLFFRAINFNKSKKIFWLPLVLTCVYGVFDEIHQLFVPSRTFQLKDLLVNFSGAIIGLLARR